MNKPLSEEIRRHAFQTLVAKQDAGLPIGESRQQTAIHFQITLEEMLRIEREGITKRWSPLD